MSLYSRQIKDLARFFGTPLTRRVGRTGLLAETTQRWASRVRSHFKDHATIREAAGAVAPVYTLGASPSLLEWWLWHRLANTPSAPEPESRVRTVVQRSAELVRSVESNELDAALVRSDAIPRELTGKPLYSFGRSPFALAKNFSTKANMSKAAFARIPLALAAGGADGRRPLGPARSDRRRVFGTFGAPSTPSVFKAAGSSDRADVESSFARNTLGGDFQSSGDSRASVMAQRGRIERLPGYPARIHCTLAENKIKQTLRLRAQIIQTPPADDCMNEDLWKGDFHAGCA